MDQVTFQIIELLVCFAAAVTVTLIAKGLIPAVKNTMSEDQLDTIKDWIQTFVYMAEQVFQNTSGVEKKRIVTNRTKQILETLNVHLTEQQISDLIEAAVKGMRIAEGKIPKKAAEKQKAAADEGVKDIDKDQ